MASASAPSLSSGQAEATPPVILTIGDLKGTLHDEHLLEAFIEYLRKLDGKAKAAREIKGRFERTLDFVLKCEELYALPQGEDLHQRNLLLEMESLFITCSPSERLTVTSQVALSHFRTHLRDLRVMDGVVVNLELTRPVYEESVRKVQQKHDLWKKHYKPQLSLNAILCLLS